MATALFCSSTLRATLCFVSVVMFLVVALCDSIRTTGLHASPSQTDDGSRFGKMAAESSPRLFPPFEERVKFRSKRHLLDEGEQERFLAAEDCVREANDISSVTEVTTQPDKLSTRASKREMPGARAMPTPWRPPLITVRYNRHRNCNHRQLNLMERLERLRPKRQRVVDGVVKSDGPCVQEGLLFPYGSTLSEFCKLPCTPDPPCVPECPSTPAPDPCRPGCPHAFFPKPYPYPFPQGGPPNVEYNGPLYYANLDDPSYPEAPGLATRTILDNITLPFPYSPFINTIAPFPMKPVDETTTLFPLWPEVPEGAAIPYIRPPYSRKQRPPAQPGFMHPDVGLHPYFPPPPVKAAGDAYGGGGGANFRRAAFRVPFDDYDDTEPETTVWFHIMGTKAAVQVSPTIPIPTEGNVSVASAGGVNDSDVSPRILARSSSTTVNAAEVAAEAKNIAVSPRILARSAPATVNAAERVAPKVTRQAPIPTTATVITITPSTLGTIPELPEDPNCVTATTPEDECGTWNCLHTRVPSPCRIGCPNAFFPKGHPYYYPQGGPPNAGVVPPLYYVTNANPDYPADPVHQTAYPSHRPPFPMPEDYIRDETHAPFPYRPLDSNPEFERETYFPLWPTDAVRQPLEQERRPPAVAGYYPDKVGNHPYFPPRMTLFTFPATRSRFINVANHQRDAYRQPKRIQDSKFASAAKDSISIQNDTEALSVANLTLTTMALTTAAVSRKQQLQRRHHRPTVAPAFDFNKYLKKANPLAKISAAASICHKRKYQTVTRKSTIVGKVKMPAHFTTMTAGWRPRCVGQRSRMHMVGRLRNASLPEVPSTSNKS